MATAQLLTVRQFAGRIGVSPRTAYRIIADGLVDRVDVGRGSKPKTRISEAALERYLERREVKGRHAS
jgi:excisionase family DNA binding protein